MEREIIDILTFGTCLGALVRTIFAPKVDLHWCVAAAVAALYVVHRGFDLTKVLHSFPPHSAELGAALYLLNILVKQLRDTPSRRRPRYSPRRFA